MTAEPVQIWACRRKENPHPNYESPVPVMAVRCKGCDNDPTFRGNAEMKLVSGPIARNGRATVETKGAEMPAKTTAQRSSKATVKKSTGKKRPAAKKTTAKSTAPRKTAAPKKAPSKAEVVERTEAALKMVKAAKTGQDFREAGNALIGCFRQAYKVWHHLEDEGK